MGPRLFIAFYAATLSTACGERDAAQSIAACADDRIAVSDAWMRPAFDGQPTAAAYATICNGAGADDALIAAAMDGAATVEIHESRTDERGVSGMTPLTAVDIDGGTRVDFAPGGLHFMIVGLDRAVGAGDAPTLRLEFEKAGVIETTLAVRDDAAAGHASH